MVDDKKASQKNMKQLNDRYMQRYVYVKQGQEACRVHDFKNGIKYYNIYLKIISDVKDVDDHYKLRAKQFTEKQDVGETLLISHIFWDLCKIYDLSEKLEADFLKSLDKFIEFSIGTDYQFLNAELLRKHIRKGRTKHLKEYRSAYQKISMGKSLKCYVATYCFGEDFIGLWRLRRLKNDLILAGSMGVGFVKYYYIYSPRIIFFAKKHSFLGVGLKCIIRPILLIIIAVLLIYDKIVAIKKYFFSPPHNHLK